MFFKGHQLLTCLIMNLSDGKSKAWDYFNNQSTENAYATVKLLIDSYPDDAELKYLLGCCHGKLGNYTAAVESFNLSLALSPEQPYTHIALGDALKACDQVDLAIQNYQKALQLNPAIAEAHIALGNENLSGHKINEARYHYIQASRLAPQSALAYYKLGMLAKRENIDSAVVLKYFSKAINAEPQASKYLFAMGKYLAQLERYDEAVIKLTHAIKLNSNHFYARSSLLTIYIKLGKYNLAEYEIDYLLDKTIFLADAAVSFLLVCKHLKRCDEALDYANQCLNSEISAIDTVNINRQMAMVLEYQKQYDKAWQCLLKSKPTHQMIDSYDVIKHKKIIDNLIETFTSSTLFQLTDSHVKSERPIFIVGMPRSGTSLTEQILCSHPDVSGAGELMDISNLIDSVRETHTTEKPWPACITEINQNELEKLANNYLFRLQLISTSTRYVIDKMPHNFYALGFIQMLLPNAKIIHCRRHPLDTCLSIYFQNFLTGHEYANDLFNLGAHYHQYQRLMQHWRIHLSIKVFDLDYEVLVSKPEETISKLLEFCDLEWNEKCVKFNGSDKVISTASFDQVRQPLHKNSVSRWEKYESHLDDLKKGLERGY